MKVRRSLFPADDAAYPMDTEKELSLSQQIEYLRRFAEVWPLPKVAVVCMLIAIAAASGFAFSSNESLKVLLLFVAGVSGVVAFAVATQLAGLRRAALATRKGRRVHGVLHLTVDRSDSENVVISGDMREGGSVWKLHFGKPLGWTPQSGEWPCEMVMLDGETVPALVQLEQGLLFPIHGSGKVPSGGG